VPRKILDTIDGCSPKLETDSGFEWREVKAYLLNPGISLSGHID